MITPQESREHRQVIRKPVPIRIASHDIVLHDVRYTISNTARQHSRGRSDFAQPLQRSYRRIELDKHLLLSMTSDKTGFLLSILWSGDDPIGGLEVVLKDASNHFFPVVHNDVSPDAQNCC